MVTKPEFQNLSAELLAGGISGSIAQIVFHPLDTVKTVYQSKPKHTYSAVIQDIYKIGVTNFWKGCTIPATSFGLVNSVSFASYYTSKKYFDPYQESISVSVACACFSGVCQLIPWVPSELIKIQMQILADRQICKSVTVMSSIRAIYATYGVKGFYLGTVAQLMRDIPNNIAYYITYEELSKYLEESFKFGVIEKSIISGGVTGLISWVIVIPMDLVKTRIQSRTDRDLISSYKKVISLGFLSFFHGTNILLARSFTVNAMIFFIYEHTFPVFNKLV